MAGEASGLYFSNDAQRDCYLRLARYMRDAFPDRVVANPDKPAFRITGGSTAVDITVFACDGNAVVHSRALAVRGAELAPELLIALLRQNDALSFGSFALELDGDVVFTNTTLAGAVTRESLETEVAEILGVVDHFDDLIQNRWGGLRTVDRGRKPRDAQRG